MSFEEQIMSNCVHNSSNIFCCTLSFENWEIFSDIRVFNKT